MQIRNTGNIFGGISIYEHMLICLADCYGIDGREVGFLPRAAIGRVGLRLYGDKYLLTHLPDRSWEITQTIANKILRSGINFSFVCDFIRFLYQSGP